MMKNYQKFYKFLELLYLETDENHILSMKNLINKMSEITGEKIDRRIIYDYIDNLRELGYDISDYNENKIGYYMRGRKFEEYEIRILLDLITACRSVTHKKTKEIIRKIKSLGNRYIADKLQSQLYIDNRAKTQNEQIFYNISNINEAINNNRKISFTYYHYSVGKELVPRKQNNEIKIYVVNPIAMILKKDCYYLVCFSDKRKSLTHYRIDRMQKVDVLEDERTSINEIEEFKNGFDAALYSKRCFNMYSGKEFNIVLRADTKLLDSVIDELQGDVDIVKEDDTHFIAKFTARYSKGLTRWIMQYGKDIKILEPEILIENIKKEIKDLSKTYE